MNSSVRIRLNPTYWRHRSLVPFSDDISPSSLFLKHSHYAVLDIETQKLVQEVGGWDHVDKLGVSVACIYDSKTDRMRSFLEKEIPELIKILEDRLVVGFNIRGFDLPCLVPYGLDPKKLDVFDLLYDLENLTRQRFIKLDYLAKGTLGSAKSADGLQAVEWYKRGEIDKIIEYCMQDVAITRDLFQFGRQNGFVKIQRGEEPPPPVPVQWN